MYYNPLSTKVDLNLILLLHTLLVYLLVFLHIIYILHIKTIN